MFRRRKQPEQPPTQATRAAADASNPSSRRRKQPEQPPTPRDPLAALAMTWRRRAADLTVWNLRIGVPTHRRALNAAEARAYMHAASELEHALEET